MTAGQDRAALAGELRIVLGRLVRRLRVQHRFPLTQAAVLGRLDRDGAQSIGDLAAAERVRSQSMSQTLADLEAEGLVGRRPDATDGRRTLIELTASGRTALREDRAARDGWLAVAIEESLSDDELSVLERAVPILARLSEM